MTRASTFCTIVTAAVLTFVHSAPAQTPIVVRGSDTLGDEMVPRLAEAYTKAGNVIPFDIVAEGSSAAFKALKSGAAIGLSSRPIKDSERQDLADAGLTVNEHVAGIDMIAVIVNESNSVDDVPLAAIEKIFTSAVTTWKTLPNQPAIKAFTRNEKSGTYKVFQKVGMAGKDYGKMTVKCEGNGEIAQKVTENPGGVGYVGLSYAKAPGVKALKIDGVTPDPQFAAKYALSRKLYYYTIEGKASPEALKFIQWATTDKVAASIISDVGFIAPSGE